MYLSVELKKGHSNSPRVRFSKGQGAYLGTYQTSESLFNEAAGSHCWFCLLSVLLNLSKCSSVIKCLCGRVETAFGARIFDTVHFALVMILTPEFQLVCLPV